MSKQELDARQEQNAAMESQGAEQGFASDAAASEISTVPNAGPAGADGQAGNGPQLVEEQVSRSEFEKVKAERDQLLDRMARLQAEFENARKRSEREKQEFRDYAAASVVEQFLPVLDNFELALKATGSAEQMRSGVELIVKQMEEILRQMNVTAIPAVGEAFDPRYHEALGQVERLDMPDQHVAEEIRRGYKIREKLLRPSMVRVVSNPKQAVE